MFIHFLCNVLSYDVQFFELVSPNDEEVALVGSIMGTERHQDNSLFGSPKKMRHSPTEAKKKFYKGQ